MFGRSWIEKPANENSNANVTNNIPFWYNYVYDGGLSTNNIRDGGGDMYDRGNVVSSKQDLNESLLYLCVVNFVI